MKKYRVLALLWITVLIIGCMTGCGPAAPSETQSAPPTEAPTQAAELTEPDALDSIEDTYWEAVSWYNEETCQYEPIQPESWAMDLLVRSDGTARFRDVHEQVALMDDTLLDISWEKTPEGTYAFYSVLRSEPVLQGTCQNGVMTLQYYDALITMEQRELPETVGQTYTPAELQGTWLMMSTEVEGDQSPAMPFDLASIVVSTTFDDALILVADMEERDYYEQLRYSAYDQKITVLEEPLYDGCENEAWSVRIGTGSAEDGTEFYATLLDYNTLLLQRYYTMDGNPAVSYQTYWRFPEVVSWSDPEYMELDYSNWVCVGYTNAQQENRTPPAEMEGFSVILDPDGTCLVSYSDGAKIQGSWNLYTGGVLVMRGMEDEFWFGGTVTRYCRVVDGESQNVYQMSLYYDGGILSLVIENYG